MALSFVPKFRDGQSFDPIVPMPNLQSTEKTEWTEGDTTNNILMAHQRQIPLTQGKQENIHT